jgi:hypothetical protein
MSPPRRSDEFAIHRDSSDTHTRCRPIAGWHRGSNSRPKEEEVSEDARH